ncbi:MAG: YnfA family protein [Gemmatimonadaceae bacterium]|jgi:small multidrug resistance family-3 protein|nr:YnfA family protein [Gemmatimonadaceae bacterium]
MRPLHSLTLFLVAGLMESGGGYLVWLWLRNDQSVWLGALGGPLLIFYGVLPTMQPAGFDFGRVYAAYGGVFVVLSVMWGWRIDGITPDLATVVGAAICLVGVGIIMYWLHQG